MKKLSEKTLASYIDTYTSPLGQITLGSNGNELIGLWFDDSKYFGNTLANLYQKKSLPIFDQTKQWLDCYFSGKEPDFTPALKLIGSPFQISVWQILLQIPYGQMMTYGEIAKILAHERGIKSLSAQAVGGAVGRNPISLIIPCHRIIGSNGNLTGYAAGLDKKAYLLNLEQSNN